MFYFLYNNLLHRYSGVFLACFLSLCMVPSGVSAEIKPVLSTETTISPTLFLKGMKIYPEDPFRFDFLVANETSVLNPNELSPSEAMRLVRYFLAALTVPEGDLWVNLNPDEPDRIVPPVLGQTQMGVDLLSQDYILKQLTAALMNPEGETGKEFWERIYQRIYDSRGSQDGFLEDAVETFNKVWIVPDKAEVYQNGDRAFVVEATMKVMMEDDYVVHTQNVGARRALPLQNDIKAIIRENIIPVLENEVNNGESFAPLRQMYYAMILAKWYEQHFKTSFLGQSYVDHNSIEGIRTSKDQEQIQNIYNQYVSAFKQGAYDLIREDYDPVQQEIVAKKYFSGGFDGTMEVTAGMLDEKLEGNMAMLQVEFSDVTPSGGFNPAMASKGSNSDIWGGKALWNAIRPIEGATFREFYKNFVDQHIEEGFLPVEKLKNSIKVVTLPGGYELVDIEHRKGNPKPFVLEQYWAWGKFFDLLYDRGLYGIYLLGAQALRDVVYRLAFHIFHGQESYCSICKAFKPLNQQVISMGRFHKDLKDWGVQINLGFWAVDDAKTSPSFVIKRLKHEQVPLDEVVKTGVLLAALMPDAMLGWNGPARSAPMHAHFQGVFRRFPFLQRPLVEKNGLWTADDWPMTNFVVKGRVVELNKIIQRAQAVIQSLLAQELPENMIDLAWYHDEDHNEVRVMIFPRSKRAPDLAERTTFGISNSLGYKMMEDGETMNNLHTASQFFETMLKDVSLNIEVNPAMIGVDTERSLTETFDPGGIDMNSLSVNTSGQAAPVQIFDSAMTNQRILSGLTPKIITITGIDASQFLGLKNSPLLWLTKCIKILLQN